MSQCYKIHIEDAGVQESEAILEEATACFSRVVAYLGTGYWQGTPSDDLILEIITEFTEYPLIQTLLQSIKHRNPKRVLILAAQDVTLTIL